MSTVETPASSEQQAEHSQSDIQDALDTAAACIWENKYTQVPGLPRTNDTFTQVSQIRARIEGNTNDARVIISHFLRIRTASSPS